MIRWVLVVVLLLGSAAGSEGTLPFDPEAVVRQVSGARSGSGTPDCLADTMEFMLDTIPQGYTKTTDRVFTPVVASDGEDYLVVWRNESNPDAILAVRISSSGRMLDSTGIVLSGSGGYFTLGDVAFGDSLYMIAWTVGSARSLRCTRVSRDGSVLDPGGFPVPSTPNGHYRPSIGFANGVFLIAWHDSRSRLYWMWDIYCRGVTEGGLVLDTGDVHISASSSGNHGPVAPAVASDGHEYLVVWDSQRTGSWDIWGARVAEDGRVLDTVAFIIAGEGYSDRSPDIAFDGTNYLVTCSAGDEVLSDIHGVRVSSAGEVLDPGRLRFSTASQAQQEPSVAFDGTDYFVTWQDWRNGNKDIYGTRVTPAGTVLDPDGIPVRYRLQEEQEPAVTFGAENYLVVWLDYRWSNDADVFATRVSTSGTVLDSAFPVPDTLPLIPKFSPQLLPDVAFEGENYLVVWEDHRTAANQWDIYGIRVSPDGAVLDSASFLIAGAAGIQGNPAVAFGDSTFLVVWEDARWGDRDIYGARVSRAGVVLDPAGIPVHAGLYNQQTPAVAFDGTDFLVAYENNGRAYCASVEQSGRVLNPLSLTSSTGAKRKPAVALGDSSFLISWEDWRYSQYYSKVHAIRFSPPRGIVDSTDFLVCTRMGCYAPSVACDGRMFVVAWHEDGRVIAAARVASDGHALDSSGITLVSEPGRYYDVDAVSMGDYSFLVLRRDDVLYGVRTNRALSETDTFRLSQNPGKDQAPAIARGPDYQAFVAYACSTSAQQANGASAFRVWGRFCLDSTPMPPARLWPPNGHCFWDPPVTLLVDTMLVDADSFQFKVFVTGGDTVWSGRTTAPCCTVPDSLLGPSQHGWQCRVRNRYAWSRYGGPGYFYWRMTGVEEGPAPQPGMERVASATVFRRGQTLACAAPVSAAPMRRLEVFSADGRRVAAVEPRPDGFVRWDFCDDRGRPVGSGLYVVRLVDSHGHGVLRKLVLVD